MHHRAQSQGGVARRYDVNAKLIFTWRLDPCYKSAEDGEGTPTFLPVEVAPGDVAALKAIVLASRAELAARDAELRNRDLLMEALDQLELEPEDEEIARAAEVLSEPMPATKKQPKRCPSRTTCRARRRFSRRASAARTARRPQAAGRGCDGGAGVHPRRFVVKRIVRPRLACGVCGGFHQAPLPPWPIERGRPGPRPAGAWTRITSLLEIAKLNRVESYA